MQFRIFQYPLPCPETPAELNKFLGSHKVASVRQYFSTEGDVPMLVFVVQVVAEIASPSAKISKARVNYEEVLSSEDYRLFNQLRDERKRLADAEGIPVYSVFNNAQLASIVEAKASSVGAVAKIEGIGESKAAKYGEAIIRVFHKTDQSNP